MRPINADELKITLTNWIRLHWDEVFTADDMAYAYLEMINEELTLKMKPVVHAHWIYGYTFPDGQYRKCSACKELIKVARNTANFRKTDNWVDIAGYAACGGEISESVAADGD